MNAFRMQLDQLEQIRIDRREASEEASIVFDDYLEIYETCNEHMKYWEKMTEKPSFGNDWAFPDHPQHSAFLARLRHKQQVQEFKERHRSH